MLDVVLRVWWIRKTEPNSADRRGRAPKSAQKPCDLPFRFYCSHSHMPWPSERAQWISMLLIDRHVSKAALRMLLRRRQVHSSVEEDRFGPLKKGVLHQADIVEGFFTHCTPKPSQRRLELLCPRSVTKERAWKARNSFSLALPMPCHSS